MTMRQLKIPKQVTPRDNISVDKYLQEVAKSDLITPEEEVVLAKRIQAGDGLALEIFVKANLRFVVSVAKQYQWQWLTLPDLINDGNLGLIKAAQRYDEKRWFKFISYAVWWIRQSILQALADQSRTIRVPLNVNGHLNKIHKMESRIEQLLCREPINYEIARCLLLDQKMREKFERNATNEELLHVLEWTYDVSDEDITKDEEISDTSSDEISDDDIEKQIGNDIMIEKVISETAEIDILEKETDETLNISAKDSLMENLEWNEEWLSKKDKKKERKKFIITPKYIDSLKTIWRPVSLDTPINNDPNNDSFWELLVSNDFPDTDYAVVKDESLSIEIWRALATLSEKERDILILYYGIGLPHSLTLEEIAVNIELTRERVRQIKEKAIKKLKKASKSKLLKSYLGQ